MALEIFKLFGSIMVDSDKATESISKTEEKAEGFSKKLLDGIGTAGKWSMAVAASIGGAALTVGGLAVKTADDYKKALNQLQVETGATKEEMQSFGEVVKGVYGNNFGESFEDVANSVAMVNKNLNLSGQELQDITELAIGYSDSFDVGVNESTRSAKALMDQFGISAEEAYNLMVQGQQQGLNFSDELIDSINEYSVHFSQIGLDAEDMFNIFADGAKSGAFNLDKVGDAVKELGIKVKEGSANDALKKLGLNADDIAKKFNKGGEEGKKAFYEIFKALGKVDDQTKLNNIGTELMGTMFEDLGKEAVLALGGMGDEFNKTIDSARQMNEIKYDSFSEAITGIKRQVETNILLPMGEMILPTLNNFANWFANEGQIYLKAFSDTVMDVMPYVQEVFLAVFDIITNTLLFFKQVFEGIIGDVNFNWNDFMQMLNNLWLTYGKPVFDGFMSIVQTVYDNISPILAGLQSLWSIMVSYYQTVWDSIGKPVFMFFIEIVNKLKDTFNFVFPIVANVFAGMCDTLNRLWLTILQPVFAAIMNLIQGVLLPVFRTVFDAIAGVVRIVFSNIGTYWTTVLKPIFDGIISFIGGVFRGNWSMIWEGILSILKGLWGQVKTVIWSPIEWAVNKISGIAETIISPFRKAKDAISGLWSSLKSVFKVPHFTFTGSMNPLKWADEGTPKIGVEWYAKGGVLNEPTVFGMNGPNLMVGGEAGPEAVAPIETLMKYIDIAVRNAMETSNNKIPEQNMTLNVYSPDPLTPSEVARQVRNTQRRMAYDF